MSHADMAELADAHGSGPCEGYFMGVRIPLSAPDQGTIFNTKQPSDLEGCFVCKTAWCQWPAMAKIDFLIYGRYVII